MTTLPQTTPMRLPRPAGGAGQIAIPSAPVPGALGPAMAGGGGAQMTGADVWRVFRSNWWLILGLVTLTGVGGYFANDYLAKNHPRYTATAYVRVQLPEEVFRPRGIEGNAAPQTI